MMMMLSGTRMMQLQTRHNLRRTFKLRFSASFLEDNNRFS